MITLATVVTKSCLKDFSIDAMGYITKTIK